MKSVLACVIHTQLTGNKLYLLCNFTVQPFKDTDYKEGRKWLPVLKQIMGLILRCCRFFDMSKKVQVHSNS